MIIVPIISFETEGLRLHGYYLREKFNPGSQVSKTTLTTELFCFHMHITEETMGLREVKNLQTKKMAEWDSNPELSKAKLICLPLCSASWAHRRVLDIGARGCSSHLTGGLYMNGAGLPATQVGPSALGVVRKVTEQEVNWDID